MTPLNGLNLIPSFLQFFLPSFFLPAFLPPSPLPPQTQGTLEGCPWAREEGHWGLDASRVGVSGKNTGCQEHGGQETARCFLVSHKGDWEIFFGRSWDVIVPQSRDSARDGVRTSVFWDVIEESSGEKQRVGPLSVTPLARLLLSKQSQTPALPEVKSLSACAPDRSGFGLIFGRRCSKLGAGSEGGGGWGRSADWPPRHQGAHCCFGIFFFL